MELFEAINTRRSIRKYTSEPVCRELLDKLLAAAMQAPSARNLQPWHFVITDDKTQLQELSKLHPYGKMMASAAWVVLVCGNLDQEPEPGYNAINCSAAIENILLAANASGIGAVWLGVYPRDERMKQVGAFFSLPAHILPIGLISLGWPAEEKEVENRYQAARIHYKGW